MYAIRSGGSSTSYDMNERLCPNKALNLTALTAGAVNVPSAAFGCSGGSLASAFLRPKSSRFFTRRP
jgi:hypothetical protein